MKKPVLLIVTLVVVAGAAVGAAATFHLGPWAPSDALAAPPRDLGPVVATVDGDPVYLSQIMSRVEGIASIHGGLEDSLGKDWQDKLLQNVVDDKIIEHAAASYSIDVTDQEISTHLADLRGYFPDEAAFQKWLEDGQMDERELADRIRLQTLASELYLRVTEDVDVTREAALAWYEGHPDKYLGVDGSVSPFFAVRDEVEKTLLKKERDRAYAEWLDTARTDVDVVVVMQDWWKEIAA